MQVEESSGNVKAKDHQSSRRFSSEELAKILLDSLQALRGSIFQWLQRIKDFLQR